MREVKIKDYEKANIMVLMLKRIIEKNLKDEMVLEKIKDLNLSLVVRVGRMTATIYFDKGEILIENKEIQNPSAYVEGNLKDFLNVGLGRSLVLPVLTRRIKFGGDVLSLLPIMKLFRI